MFLYLIRLIRRYFCQLFGFPNRQLIDQKPDLSKVIAQKAKLTKSSVISQKAKLTKSPVISQKAKLTNSPVISQKAKSSKVKLMNQKTALSKSKLTTQKASLSIKPSFGTTARIPTFDEYNGDFATYYGILEEFFLKNDVPEKKKTSYLICFIGRQSYKTLKDLCRPELPSTKTFNELCHKLLAYYAPKSKSKS